MLPLDPDLLRAFVMVAETNNFTKASERLFRTQAAISMQIKRLEDRVGKPLFVRGPHGAQLTREGELLIHYARRILLLNDEAHASLSDSLGQDVVRIAVPDEYGRIVLPNLLVLFSKSYPEVQLDIVVGSGISSLERVRDGNVDLALVIRPSEARDGELLRRERLHWITSRHRSPHTSELLTLGLLSKGCVRRDIALHALKEAGRDFRVLLTSDTMAPIISAVSSGLAISVAEGAVIPAELSQLGESDGLPPLGTVDLVLHRAPGHQRRPTATLAEHLRFSLRT